MVAIEGDISCNFDAGIVEDVNDALADRVIPIRIVKVNIELAVKSFRLLDSLLVSFSLNFHGAIVWNVFGKEGCIGFHLKSPSELLTAPRCGNRCRVKRSSRVLVRKSLDVQAARFCQG